MKRAIVLAFENCLTSSVVGILDMLSVCDYLLSGNDSDEPMFTTSIAASSLATISGFNALPIQPTMTIQDELDADIIIVPPIMCDFEGVINNNRELVSWLTLQHSSGAIVCSVCSGIFFLAEAGLLNGYKATTNPLLKNLVASQYPKIDLNVDKLVVDQGSLITSGTTYAFVDLIIYLLEKYYGSEVARNASKLFLHDKNRHSQASYLVPPLKHQHNNDEILQVQQWLGLNFHSSFSIASLADRCNMSLRNFSRKFQEATGETPTAYIHFLRVESAKNSLENSNKSVSEIVYDIGYSDQKSFSRLFKRHTNLTPSEYRKRFLFRQF